MSLGIFCWYVFRRGTKRLIYWLTEYDREWTLQKYWSSFMIVWLRAARTACWTRMTCSTAFAYLETCFSVHSCAPVAFFRISFSGRHPWIARARTRIQSRSWNINVYFTNIENCWTHDRFPALYIRYLDLAWSHQNEASVHWIPQNRNLFKIASLNLLDNVCNLLN